MTWVIAGTIGVSVVSSMMGEADQNAAMESKARAFGVRKAGIAASKEQALDAIVANTAQLRNEAALVGADIEKSEAAAEAQARVNAAAAGVEGASVDVSIAQSDVNAANAKGKLDARKKQNEEQLKLNFINTIINAETQTGTLDTSTQNQTGKHVLAGAGAFLGTF